MSENVDTGTRKRRRIPKAALWLIAGFLLGTLVHPLALMQTMWQRVYSDSTLRFLQSLSVEDIETIEVQLRMPDSYNLTSNGKMTPVILKMPEDRAWVETFLEGLKDLRYAPMPSRLLMKGQQVNVRRRGQSVGLRFQAVSPEFLAVSSSRASRVSPSYTARLVPALTTRAVIGKLIEEKKLCIPPDAVFLP